MKAEPAGENVSPRGSATDGRAIPPNGPLPALSTALDPYAVARLDELVKSHESELIAFRRRLHAEPELSFEEVATTNAVDERLLVDGLYPLALGSGTGLYCDIGSGDRIVALRAELDALAMDDVKEVPYRSRRPGIAHACGHDVHTAVVMGAGLVLNRLDLEGLLPGKVRLIFEPGEEKVPGGAVEIVEAGLLDGVEKVFAVHCDPKINVGTIGTRIGAITSASDLVEITVEGPGGHTARPNRTINLIAVMADLVARLPADLERRMGGPETCRMVFGSIHSGAAANVIPARGMVAGSLRTPDREAWESVDDALNEAITEIMAGTGAKWEVRHVRGVPPVINEESAARTLARNGRAFLGQNAVVETEHSWGGDSFGWMTAAVPGSFARLGTHNPLSDELLDLHHSRFDADERAIGIGARLLALSALDVLSSPPPG